MLSADSAPEFTMLPHEVLPDLDVVKRLGMVSNHVYVCVF